VAHFDFYDELIQLISFACVGDKQLLYFSKAADIWSDTYLSKASTWRHTCDTTPTTWRGDTLYAMIWDVHYLTEHYQNALANNYSKPWIFITIYRVAQKK